MDKHKTTRRNFIKLGLGAGAASAAALALDKLSDASTSTGYSQGAVDEEIVRTTCALCPSGCGLEVRVADGRAVKVEGNPLHPLNQGVCCLRGQASLEALYSPERLPKPRRRMGERGEGLWEEIPWDEALAMVAEQLIELRQRGQAHTLAVLHGPTHGQLRGTLDQFMRAYGSPNLISQQSLETQAARLSMYLMQGINGLPVYDFNNANYVMAFGGNLLESSRNVIGTLAAMAFMRRGRPQRGKLVYAHPRMSLTGIKADEWVPLRPGTEAALALGMAYVIVNSGLYDQEFVENYCFGFEDFEDEDGVTHQGFKSLLVEHYTLDKVASITGVTTDVIARLAGEFATNHPAVAVIPTEVGGLANGNSLYTAMAVQALNALVGSIDVKGGVLVQRFPDLTPWPEVESDRVNRRGLAQPRIDGAGRDQIPLAYSAYQQVAENILDDDPYAINAVILVDTNPVYEVPNQGQFASALLKVPFVVSLTTVPNESSSHADLILPVSTFLEEWSDEFMDGTGYPGVSLRRPVVERVHDTQGVGDILLRLAQMIGGPLETALPFSDYKTLVEYRLGSIDTDWDTFLENGSWSEMVYYNAAPGSEAWGDVVGRDRFNAPKDGRFDFFSRELFHLLQPDDDLVCLPHFDLPANLQVAGQGFQEYPFMLISQSLITQTQSWPGILPTIQDCYGLQGNVKWSSWVEISPLAAEDLGVEDGEMVVVESPHGSAHVPVRVYEGLWPNAVFMPGGMGHLTSVNWGREEAAPNFIGENPRQLVRMGTEPISGCAIFSPQRVRITKA